jgi:uncharacterized membrane protein
MIKFIHYMLQQLGYCILGIITACLVFGTLAGIAFFISKHFATAAKVGAISLVVIGTIIILVECIELGREVVKLFKRK